MKKSPLTLGYFLSLLFAAAVLGWAVLASWHSSFVRTDAGVISLFNAAYWFFAFYVLRKGELRTGGSLVAHTEDPKRFSVYFGVLILMGIVAAVVGASILMSKASRALH